MQSVLKLQNLPVMLTVLLFVLLLICLLIIVDHKAKLPGERRDDFFSIAGKRSSHPIWAWLTSSLLLWVTIGALLISWVWGIVAARAKPAEQPKILTRLDSEARAERLRHFHNMPASNPLEIGKRNACYYCHGDFPHSKKAMVRTLLNMHTQFIGCMTCHFNETKVAESVVKLRWLNASGIAVSGPPFGTDVDPVTGDLIQTDDWYSKIVPYQMDGDQEKLMEITEDAPEAREFIKVRDKLKDSDRELVKQSFHRQINPVGRFCSRCHVAEEESFLPFKELGFSDKRVRALTNVNIVGLVQKYREFYLPTIFDRHLGAEKEEALIGSSKDNEATHAMKKDPRTWWRHNFEPPPKQEKQNAKPEQR